MKPPKTMPRPGRTNRVATSDVKCTWCIGTETQDVHEITMLHPKVGTCNDQCPWLAANHGKNIQ